MKAPFQRPARPVICVVFGRSPRTCACSPKIEEKVDKRREECED